MKRVVVVLCALAAAVLLLLLLSRSADAPRESPRKAPTLAGPPDGSSPPTNAGTPSVIVPEPPAVPPPAGPGVKGLKDWAPRGRVVDRATGNPIFWTDLTYQVRFRVSDENPGSWSERREPPAEGEESPEDPGAFDLAKTVGHSPMDVHAARENLSVAEFRESARAPGFRKGATDWTRWGEFPRDRALTVELDADVPARLIARVRTGEGAPFHGRAALSLYDEEEWQGIGPVEADAEGVLLFEGLPSGKFGISVDPVASGEAGVLHINGDGSTAREILLPPGGKAEAEFVLARVGEIGVDVAAVDGSPIEAWVVDYQYRRGSGSGGASPRRITGCPPGDYEVKVWSRGFVEWKTTVRVEAGAAARVEARLEREPWSDFLKRVPDEVYAWLDRTAAELAKEDSLEAARLALVRAIREEVWSQVSAASGFGDGGPEARAGIQEAWKNRATDFWRKTSYGTGTFVVLARPAGAGQTDGAPEEWWKGATADHRKDWLLSWCAEKCGFVEVVRVRDDPCPVCGEPGDRETTEP